MIVSISIKENNANIQVGTLTSEVSNDYYDNWADFYAAFSALKYQNAHTFHLSPTGRINAAFNVVHELDNSHTLQRVNNSIYVNVESDMTCEEAIDRLHLIYCNGTEYHQMCISALDIDTCVLATA